MSSKPDSATAIHWLGGTFDMLSVWDGWHISSPLLLLGKLASCGLFYANVREKEQIAFYSMYLPCDKKLHEQISV